ncbi:MAG: kelch repeat-containing protein [Saprospiraceae bacterium]
MKRILYFVFFLSAVNVAIGQKAAPPTLHLEPVPGFFQTPVDGNMIQPTGVAVNSKGHVFAFNKGNRQLMEFDAQGQYVRSLGQGIFKDPHGLRIDNEDNIWTTDLVAHVVIKMNPEGRVLMVLGENGTSGLYNEARNMVLFFKPADIAFSRNGDIFVADGYGNHRVVKMDKTGKFIKTWGKQGPEEGNFNNPHNIVIDHQDRLYIADRHNARIQVFDTDGKFLKAWTNVGKPWGLAFSTERNLYMTEGDSEKVLKLDLEGNILGEFKAGSGTQEGQFRAAHGIAVGPGEELFVTEVLNWRVQKLVQHLEKGDWHRILTNNGSHRRHESAFVEVDGKFYALGGRNTRKVDIFDPKTDSWSQGADAPQEIHHFQAISYKGEIWIIGAFTGPYPKEEPIEFIHVYNPKTNRWRIGGKQPEGRERGAAGIAIYQDKFYLLCGNTEGHFTGHNKWFDEFDPATGQWKTLADAPHTRDHFQVAIIDGKLYAAGGRNTSAKTNHVMDLTVPEVDVYDFAKGSWSTLPSTANFPTLRAGTTAIVHGDQLIVMGGESGSQEPAHSEVEAYDVSDGKWHSLAPMLQGRHGTQAILYQGKMYIAGGASSRGGGPELRSIDCWDLEK